MHPSPLPPPSTLRFVLGLLYFFRFHFVFFLIFEEFCWMRGLCISFTSSCFLFLVGGGFEDWGRGGVGGEGVNILGLRWGLPIWGGIFAGVSTPLHGKYIFLPLPLSHSHHLSSLQYSVLQYSFCSDKVYSSFSFTHFESGLCQ